MIMGCLYLRGAIIHMVKQKIGRCETCISAKSPIVRFLHFYHEDSQNKSQGGADVKLGP